MTQRFCRHCSGWHQVEAWPEECWKTPVQSRSDLPMPMIAVDSTEPLRSMADGKIYTSKAAMRQSYKASNNPKGINYTEVGDDRSFTSPAPKPLKRADRADIKDTIERAKADVSRGMYDHVE